MDHSLVITATTIAGTACAVVYATAKLLALKIVLKDSTPSERAPLVAAVAELFRPRPLPGRPDALPSAQPPDPVMTPQVNDRGLPLPS